MTAPGTAVLTVGSRLICDGELLIVVGIEAERLILVGEGGRRLSMQTAALLADPGTRLVGVCDAVPEVSATALRALGGVAASAVFDRLRHVREVMTGYGSGYAEFAAEGEPRPAYDPSLPAKERYAAKAAELGVGLRTVERWVAEVRRRGAAGLVDGRSAPVVDRLRGVDGRWLSMCRIVLAEHVDASRPTMELVLRRVSARLAAEHGAGVVPEPGRKRARAVLAEITRGSNAFVGSTKGKRSIAGRPAGVYGRLRATRPGEYVLLDTTSLDVFALEPLTLRWIRVELTIAMDLFSRAITGLRLSPVSTKSVDAALVLFETLSPDASRPGGGLLPWAGLPDEVVMDAEDVRFAARPGSAATAAETLVVDHGKIYLSEHLLGVCGRLGISIQPARPLTPTDKAAVERFFKTLADGLLAALPGYKGSDVYSRGRDPEGCAYYFTDELEQLIRQWICEVYHRRPHAGLVEPAVPGLELSPAEMFAAGIARAGRLRVPASADSLFEFLPVAWRTIQHYGVEVNRLRYDGPALTGYRNRLSPFTGVHAGKWPIRHDPDDARRVFFQDPADGAWHALAWEHAQAVGVAFSAESLAYARRLAVAAGRHVDERQALADLLERFDTGLMRHPAERRMAVRASELRRASLATPAAARWQPMVSGPTDEPEAARGPGGDDDDPGELSVPGSDECAEVGDEQFYAEALEVLS